MPSASPSVIVALGRRVRGERRRDLVLERQLVADARHDAALDDLRRHARRLDRARQQRVLGLAVDQATDHVRPAGVAELEPDEHLVADFGQEQVAPLLAHADLHDPRPVASRSTGASHGKPSLTRPILSGSLLLVTTPITLPLIVAGRTLAPPERGQAEQRAVVAAADLEVRRVAADIGVEHVAGRGDDPLAR